MDYDEWLIQVKVGDSVAIRSGYGYGSFRIATIERLTPTQFVIGTERFRKQDGFRIGDGGFVRTRLHQITDEVRKFVLLQKIESGIIRAARAMNLEQLAQLESLMQSSMKDTSK